MLIGTQYNQFQQLFRIITPQLLAPPMQPITPQAPHIRFFLTLLVDVPTALLVAPSLRRITTQQFYRKFVTLLMRCGGREQAQRCLFLSLGGLGLPIAVRGVLWRYMASVQIIFTFQIYKINKYVRKYSRGRAGKYVLI